MSQNSKILWIMVQGGGDLASGVALRLHRCGLQVLVTELPQPLVVRRGVAFAEAVYDRQVMVEDVVGRRFDSFATARNALKECIPVLVDPDLSTLTELKRLALPVVLVDARMTKHPSLDAPPPADFVIGLGPGFQPGINCHAAVETNRGHRLGRVLWSDAPQSDTGVPELVGGHGVERVLRSPAAGLLTACVGIGAHVEAGQVVAEVDGHPVRAGFPGVVRGLVRPGLLVTPGLKIGDIDPRDDPRHCFNVSDKSLAIGGAVLEAILSRPELRPFLWDMGHP